MGIQKKEEINYSFKQTSKNVSRVISFSIVQKKKTPHLAFFFVYFKIWPRKIKISFLLHSSVISRYHSLWLTNYICPAVPCSSQRVKRQSSLKYSTQKFKPKCSGLNIPLTYTYCIPSNIQYQGSGCSEGIYEANQRKKKKRDEKKLSPQKHKHNCKYTRQKMTLSYRKHYILFKCKL